MAVFTLDAPLCLLHMEQTSVVNPVFEVSPACYTHASFVFEDMHFSWGAGVAPSLKPFLGAVSKTVDILCRGSTFVTESPRRWQEEREPESTVSVEARGCTWEGPWQWNGTTLPVNKGFSHTTWHAASEEDNPLLDYGSFLLDDGNEFCSPQSPRMCRAVWVAEALREGRCHPECQWDPHPASHVFSMTSPLVLPPGLPPQRLVGLGVPWIPPIDARSSCGVLWVGAGAQITLEGFRFEQMCLTVLIGEGAEVSLNHTSVEKSTLSMVSETLTSHTWVIHSTLKDSDLRFTGRGHSHFQATRVTACEVTSLALWARANTWVESNVTTYPWVGVWHENDLVDTTMNVKKWPHGEGGLDRPLGMGANRWLSGASLHLAAELKKPPPQKKRRSGSSWTRDPLCAKCVDECMGTSLQRGVNVETFLRDTSERVGYCQPCMLLCVGAADCVQLKLPLMFILGCVCIAVAVAVSLILCCYCLTLGMYYGL